MLRQSCFAEVSESLTCKASHEGNSGKTVDDLLSHVDGMTLVCLKGRRTCVKRGRLWVCSGDEWIRKRREQGSRQVSTEVK